MKEREKSEGVREGGVEGGRVSERERAGGGGEKERGKERGRDRQNGTKIDRQSVKKEGSTSFDNSPIRMRGR